MSVDIESSPNCIVCQETLFHGTSIIPSNLTKHKFIYILPNCNCKTILHYKCAMELFVKTRKCPICSKNINKGSLFASKKNKIFTTEEINQLEINKNFITIERKNKKENRICIYICIVFLLLMIIIILLIIFL